MPSQSTFARRNFLKRSGLGAVGLGITRSTAAEPAASPRACTTSPLTIRQVRIRHTVMPCRAHFSYGSATDFKSFFVGLRSGDTWGWGELVSSAPSGALDKAAVSMLGKDAARLDTLLDPNGPNGANEVLSQALHDLVGRVMGVSISRLIGGAARTRIPVMPCLFPESAEDAGKKARAFAEQGYQSLKFKTYGKIDEDLAHLRAIRANVPTGFILQADANCGYLDPKAFRDDYLEAFARQGLDIFEDPIKGTHTDYAALRGRTQVKIMVDIAARSNDGVREILRSNSADIVNQHPNHQGGYARSLMRANACELMGVPVWAGGTGYSGVGLGHWLHLASTRGLSLPSGEVGGWLDHAFADRLLASHPLPENGFVKLPDGPGSGVELDEAKMPGFSDSDETHK